MAAHWLLRTPIVKRAQPDFTSSMLLRLEREWRSAARVAGLAGCVRSWSWPGRVPASVVEVCVSVRPRASQVRMPKVGTVFEFWVVEDELAEIRRAYIAISQVCVAEICAIQARVEEICTVELRPPQR